MKTKRIDNPNCYPDKTNRYRLFLIAILEPYLSQFVSLECQSAKLADKLEQISISDMLCVFFRERK